jgi:O-antigen/teichoic acid export membrane protein
VLALCLFSSDSTAEQDSDSFECREYFQHSKYSTISMFSAYGQGQVDSLAVAHFLSPLSAAAYGAAKVFYTGMTMVTTGLIMVVLPTSSRLCASGNGELPSYYRKALLLGYAFLLPGAVVLAVLAHPLLHLCFAGRYDGAVPLVRIFCIASLILPVSSISDAVANGAGWFRSACIAAVAGGVVGTIMSISLTRAFGVSGAALAPIVALCVSGSVINVLIWKRLTSPTARCTTELRDVAVAAGD